MKLFVAVLLLPAMVFAESLDALVKEALDHNPEVAAAGKAWDAAKTRIPQARALDDPMVGVDVERTGTTRFDTFTDNEWMISQTVPWPGKRDAKGRVEAGMAHKAEHEFRARQLEIATLVKQAYYDLWQAQRELELNQRNQKIMEQFVKVATAKYEAGKSSQSDLLKAKTTLSKLHEDEIDREREVENARTDLTQQLGRPAEVETNVPVPMMVLSLDDAQRLAREHRPELLGVRHGMVASAKASLDLAKKSWWPDFQFRIEARQYNGQSGIREYDTGVFLNFPWLNAGKYKNAEREAKLGVERAEYEVEAMQRKTTAEVKKVYDGLRAMHHHYELFAEKLIPQQQAAVDAARSSYEADKADFLDVLEAQRMLLDYEMQNLHHVAEFHRLSAQLEQLTGGK